MKVTDLVAKANARGLQVHLFYWCSRIFSKLKEVYVINQMFDTALQFQFCGHATLAAAHTIFESILKYETQRKRGVFQSNMIY